MPTRTLVPALLALAGALPALDVDIHGFISQGWLRSADNNYLAAGSEHGTFDFTEAALNAGSQLDDRLHVSVQLLYRNLSTGEAPSQVALDYAYGDYRLADWLGVRLGRIKQPFGLYNDVRDVDVVRTAIILPQAVYPELDRDYGFAVNGGALYGTIGLGDVGSVEYQAYIGGNGLDEDSSIAQYLSSERLAVEDIDVRWFGGGHLMWNTPLPGLRAGASYRVINEVELVMTDQDPQPPGPPPGGDMSSVFTTDHMLMHAFSLEYTVGDLVLAGEYQRTRYHGEVQATRTPFPMPPMAVEMAQEGWYGMASYRLDPRWEIGSYYGSWRNMTAADPHDDSAYQKDLAASLRFDATRAWVLKAEAHYLVGTGQLALAEVPDDDHWWMVALKTTVTF